jgi:hypothetical protein
MATAWIHDILYSGAHQQRCIYCSKTKVYSGWDNLCDRRCYYGLSELINAYENGVHTIPDGRVVLYFTKYPKPSHSFCFDKVREFLSLEQNPCSFEKMNRIHDIGSIQIKPALIRKN